MIFTKDKVRKEAAQWFLRMQHAEPDHPERSKFEAWLLSSQSNAEAYSAISNLWERFDHTEGLKAMASAIQTNTQQSDFLNRKTRSKLFNGIAGLALLTLSSLLGFKLWDEWQNQVLTNMVAATAIGEMKEQQLSDGSKLTLNSDTDLAITYYRNKRVITLKRGEVIFNVVKDADRPFIVDSDFAKVTVLGTRFTVNKLNSLVRISVDHGRVRVESQISSNSNNQNLVNQNQIDQNQSAIILTNGQVAEVSQQQQPQRVDRNALDAFGFADGTIAFEQAGLEELAEVLSRYLKTPVIALPPINHKLANNAKASKSKTAKSNSGELKATELKTSQPTVSALVQIKDLYKFVNSLPHIAPINVTEENGKILLSAK